MPSNLKRLQIRHHKILELALDGFSQKAVADLMEMTPVGVGLIMRSPLFQREYSRQLEDRKSQAKEDRSIHRHRARDILDTASELAALKHVDLLEDQDSSIQLRSAKEILDRALGKEQEVASSINVTADQINLLIETAQQVAPPKDVIAKVG